MTLKATHIITDIEVKPIMQMPVCYIVVKHQISARELEYHAKFLMQGGKEKPSAKEIKKSISDSLAMSGEAAFNGLLDDENQYKKEAHDLCKKLFPTFYIK